MSIATEEWRDDADVDFRALLHIVWQRRALVAIVAAACAILAGAIGFLMTPVYRSSTVVVPAADRGLGDATSALGQLGGLASLAGIEIGGSNVEVEEALAVLRSRQFTETFIREKNLLPVLFADKWDAAAGQWRGEKQKWPTLAKGFRYFNKKVRFVVFDKKTNLVTVQVEWRDRQAAAAWANELVARVNAEMRVRAITRAGANVRYLEQELQTTTNVETRNAIGRLIEAHIKQRMLANVSQEYAFRIVDQALPSDADDPVRPQKLQLIVMGGVAGLALAILWVLIRDGRRGQSPRTRDRQ